MAESRRLSDEFVRRLVLERPIPDRLIRNLAAAGDVPRHSRKYAGRPGATMTPALWETLKLVAAGHTERRIAEELGVSLNTANDRIKRLTAYFDARNRMEVVVRCYREGII